MAPSYKISPLSPLPCCRQAPRWQHKVSTGTPCRCCGISAAHPNSFDTRYNIGLALLHTDALPEAEEVLNELAIAENRRPTTFSVLFRKNKAKTLKLYGLLQRR